MNDNKNHAVHILIDGKEIVTIDAKGLHVKGDIAYSGLITETNTKTP